MRYFYGGFRILGLDFNCHGTVELVFSRQSISFLWFHCQPFMRVFGSEDILVKIVSEDESIIGESVTRMCLRNEVRDFESQSACSVDH